MQVQSCKVGMYLHTHIHVNSVNEIRQSKVTTLKDKSVFSREKMSCLKWDSNLQCSVYQADPLPTEPLKQLSQTGQIFKDYTRQRVSLP